MIYTKENDPYEVRLAGNLLKACENGTADFLNPVTVPYYTQDMFSNQVLRDAAQLQTLLNNAAHGAQYINYAPTYLMQDNKRTWLKNIKKGDTSVGCITYKGKDESGNKHYEMMTPAGKFNPGGINENPMTQPPVPNIGVYRQTPTLDTSDPKGIEKYVTDVMGNYFNAAFTKTPYFAPQWGGQETEMLSKALNADPSLALRTAQQAYAQATSVKLENTVNQELNDNVKEAIKQGLPPFNTKKQEAIIGPVNVNGNGVPANGVPANGVDFINAYYNGINGKSGAVQSNTTETVTQNGYIPYQTHNEKPKDIDKFLVEQYGNIMNASLTGTPYSGSVTPAQLKSLASGLEAKMANDPAFMSGIANQAQQNVVGFNYMPYDKDEFIARAQDPSSREFKLLDQVIASHVKDICMNNKESFNGEFQELSKDLTEKVKDTVTAKTTRKPSTRTSAAKKDETPSAGASAANTAKTPSTRTSTARAGAAKKDEAPSVSASAAKQDVAPSVSPPAENQGERPSFLREVTNFVNKYVVERKPALVLVDTFLGSMIDKARKIVFAGKTIGPAFAIAKDALAPNVQLPVAASISKTPAANKVSASANRDASKPAAKGNVKAGESVRQRQPAKTTARR